MTIQDVINRVDGQLVNAFSERQKIVWVAQVESRIQLGRDGTCHVEQDLDQVLTAPFPWDALYQHALETQIYYALGQTERYNQAAAMYNTVLNGYRDYCRRTTLPEHRDIQYF